MRPDNEIKDVIELIDRQFIANKRIDMRQNVIIELLLDIRGLLR